MPSSAEKTVIRLRTPPAPMRVRCWPLRDEPVRSGLLVGVTLLVGALSLSATNQWLTAAVVTVLLNLSLLRLWLPTDYEFSSKGIIRSRLNRRTRMAWSDIARYDALPDGVLLCTDADPQPLTSLRCLFIRWNGKRDELLAILDYYLTSNNTQA